MAESRVGSFFRRSVKVFDSVPSAEGCSLGSASQDEIPAHLILVIKCMNADLKVTFDLNGEPVKVPCTVGVKQRCPLSPTLILFVMQACLKFLEMTMPADVKLKYRTNTRTEGKNAYFEHRLDGQLHSVLRLSGVTASSRLIRSS